MIEIHIWSWRAFSSPIGQEEKGGNFKRGILSNWLELFLYCLSSRTRFVPICTIYNSLLKLKSFIKEHILTVKPRAQICFTSLVSHQSESNQKLTTHSQTAQWSSSLVWGCQNCSEKLRRLFNGYVRMYNKRIESHACLYVGFSLFCHETHFITKFPYWWAFFGLLKLS